LEGQGVSPVVVAITQVGSKCEENQQLGLSEKEKVIEAVSEAYLVGEKTTDQVNED